jgi:alanine racemase
VISLDSRIRLPLSEIAAVAGGRFAGRDTVVGRIFTDSREGILADGSEMFIALKGERHDGHRYVGELSARGVANFMVNEDFPVGDFPESNFATVADTLDALQALARNYRDTFAFPVLGITGSNGKTCVKEWIHRIFAGTKRISRSPRSYNSQVGVPLSILMADSASELGVFEAGISMPGEMRRIERMLRPDIGIFTCIGDAHQENFGDTEQKIREKLSLFDRSRTLVYCADDERVHRAVVASKRADAAEERADATEERADATAKRADALFAWGRAAGVRLQILAVAPRPAGGAVLHLQLNPERRRMMFETPFSDPASIENLMHCIAFALLAGIDERTLSAAVAALEPVAMRLELKAGVNGCTIINDSYNSDINSLGIALNFLGGMTRHARKTLVLSDILQSDADERKLYSAVAELLRDKGITRFAGIGEALSRNSRAFAALDIERIEFYADTESFLRRCSKSEFGGEAVLLKGGRRFRFERISRLLEHKTHQTVMEVNLDALTDNLNLFRSKLKPETKLAAMVKAFSYGHGGVEIASLLQYHRVDYLAVAYADEGIELREAGIEMPIVVLNTDPDNFDLMIDYRLEPEIYSRNSLSAFLSVASRIGAVRYPVHIKVDTGMNRLGLSDDDLPALCRLIASDDAIEIASVFSHLAAADEPRHDEFTRRQIARFASFCTRLEAETGRRFTKHILNSAGIERFPEAQFDMVRLGIGLYGYGGEMRGLRRAATLRSAIVRIKTVAPDETVGYGRHGRVESARRIATVPIGYADGLDRKLGNGAGYFAVNGTPAPLIGNVCMDACMIDVTGIEAAEGDKVVIIGDNPSADDIAAILGTISYEVLTSVSRRVKRIFVAD